MMRRARGIQIKTPAQIEEMKEAGRLSAQALRLVGSLVRPGISTLELDKAAEDLIRSHGGKPAFKGYGGFPASICASANEIVVHGIPRKDFILKAGDVLSVDTGATVNGWVGDNAWTFPVSDIDKEKQALLEVTEAALWAGIAQAVPGNRIGDIGAAVQKVAEDAGFNVVREYVGHGVGRKMHEPPQVPNWGKKGTGVKLKEGMVIAIEPMVVAGKPNVHVIRDNWGVVTNDGRPAAHFEKTIAVTKDGPLVLTTDS